MSPTRSVRTSFAARQERKNSVAAVARKISEEDGIVPSATSALDLHPSAVSIQKIEKAGRLDLHPSAVSF